MKTMTVAVVLFAASDTAVLAQGYEVTRPWGNDGPAIISGPNGYRGEMSSPYGSQGPSYYSDSNGYRGELSLGYAV